MMHFAAIELKRGENPEEVIRHFVTMAADLGIRFRKVRTFGPIEFACISFIRLQTDCSTFPPIVARLKATKRSIIAPTRLGYTAFLAKGREGRVGLMVMQGIPRPGYGKEYLGPAHPYWQVQFQSGARPATAEDPPPASEDDRSS